MSLNKLDTGSLEENIVFLEAFLDSDNATVAIQIIAGQMGLLST